MKHYVGIDLGTTNSAICSFDGVEVALYKSPEQHDVTPSALFFDRRGNKYVGARAYNNAAKIPDNAAILFKRMMGTNTPIALSGANRTFYPEECSAEILRVLFGYLPEEIRNSKDTGTVITVPAAFNQMQKDATMSAADTAGIGKVALMQEPVAAVMSVMRRRQSDGTFLIYDLGGGTLDIAIAQSINGHVSLLAHGGIEMCGGRDFDRIIFNNLVKPWFLKNFDLPEDFASNDKYKVLVRMATWAAEKAKIALSSGEETLISDPDFDGLALRDESGKEIYLDIPFKTSNFNQLIEGKINDSITATQETMKQAGLDSQDVDRIVFVGGPTLYKALRDKVASKLGIASSTDVNPMTAVAEGAAVFAESIDWTSQSRGRKNSRGVVSAKGALALTFAYAARTPDCKARIAAKMEGKVLDGFEFQVDNLDSGWSSGRIALQNGSQVEVLLSKPGENTFKIFVFDAIGGPITLENNRIVITRTAAAIDAIPASHSIGVEALETIGGSPVLEYLIRKGEQLPKKGKIHFKAGVSLRAGESGEIRVMIWEGEIKNPVKDNRYVGSLLIKGTDFDDGVITAGDDINCEYEILDSGNIILEVSVPTISGTFSGGRNFYSRQAGQVDFSDASRQISKDANAMRERIEVVQKKITDPKLGKALEKLDGASTLEDGETDPETAKQAMDEVLEAKRLLAQVREEHLAEISQIDLDSCKEFFDKSLRQYATPPEESSFDNLVLTAQRSIDENRKDFKSILDEIWRKNWQILWRQDWFVVDRFKRHTQESYLFPDKRQYETLVAEGVTALKVDDIDSLRRIVWMLGSAKVGVGVNDDMFAAANIVRC